MDTSVTRKRYPEEDKKADSGDSTSELLKQERADWSERFNSQAKFGERFWLVVIISCTFLYAAYNAHYHTFPSPSNTDSPFLEVNARQFVEKVCKNGTRNVGSHANEVHVVGAIVDRIREISELAKPIHRIETDIQQPTGCYTCGVVGTYCYTNVKNILVKLSPATKESSATILVNCHQDTAISSPGASDDMVSCATMLETLRVLSRADVPLRHSILFIFNGAEETGLQAAHGFITQHPWAKELKAFVNLEAAGAGGREMVFQTGPEYPWLIAAYAQSVRYPSASVVGQEIFQSGVIPSDTDFRIYRDYGHIPGIDIAYAYNGYIYHTKYDLPEYIPEGCIQRGGENLLALLTTLGNSDRLEEPGDLKMGKMVFFDVMGFFMIYYPHRIGEVVNSLVVVAVLLNLFRRLKSFRQSGGNAGLYVKLVGASYAMHAAALLSIIGCNLALGLLVSYVRPMMWYTNNWLTFPIYILPAIAIWILVHQRGKQLCKTVFQLVSIWDIEAIYFDSALLFWTILLAALTMGGVASAYICMLLVIFPLILRQLVSDMLNIRMHNSPILYLTLTAGALLLPSLHIMQLSHSLNNLFLPLTGRMGSAVFPDILVSLISVLPFLLISNYLAGFLHISKDLTGLAAKFLSISSLFILIGCFTNLGFPYSANPASPSAQRHIFTHFWRELYAYDGTLEKEDHGLLYIPFDYNEHRYLDNIPELKSMQLQTVDKDLAYGGFPIYYSKITKLKRYHVGKLAKPLMYARVNVTHRKEQLANNIVRHHLTCSGNHFHGNIYLSVVEGGELIGWSFTPGTPIPTKIPKEIKRSHYFIYTSSAMSPHPANNFWLDIQVGEEADLDKHWLDIGFAAHYLDGPESTTPELTATLAKFPNWTVPLGWVATYQHYRF
ncbi:endoplasmic reticulum metallopeptidase 1-like [Watersipora subatra]|uniref:endoplasmic reticulum metallopeptidase 1-like n=1 Tax=Watersipora subatra TaxID=2589382 RepID=UPI00355C1164